MERFRYDRGSKWLIDHHGDMILRLGGIVDVVAWKACAAEVVQPRQLPDGLLEVVRQGRPKKDLFLIEIETYGDRRLDDQVFDDLMLVYQAKGVVPEVVVVVLRPKGLVLGSCEVASSSGRTRIAASWPIVELWKLSAQDMLALREPGLVPWITLMESSEPPEMLLKECRQVLDERAKPEEINNILAVSQVFASLRYNDQWLFNFFGGKEAMIESPYLNSIVAEQVALRYEKELPLRLAQLEKEFAEQIAQKERERAEQIAQRERERAEQIAQLKKEFAERIAEEERERAERATELAQFADLQVAKQMRIDLLRILKCRFGVALGGIPSSLEKVTDKAELDALADYAVSCPDLEAFRQKLPQ